MTCQTRIFVGGVPSDATSDRLCESFSKFGDVVSCELKSKSSDPEGLQFAFVTLSTDQSSIEACLSHFAQTKWQGTHLHVTRARESFLERLQKERQQAQTKKPAETPSHSSNDNHEGFKIRKPQVPSLNIKKPGENRTNGFHNGCKSETSKNINSTRKLDRSERSSNIEVKDEKQLSSDSKRLESMRRMRQQFNEKKHLIKSGLAGVDKTNNKRIKFEDDESEPPAKIVIAEKKDVPIQNGHPKVLFDDDSEEEDDVNFQIKEQFEGKRGQKVLELQSRFKSDKRFTLDERFIEDEDDKEKQEQKTEVTEQEDEIQVLEEDEKTRQLNILQNVLGHAIRGTHTQPEKIVDTKKTKVKLGMLRFDPNQPEHAKFLAPKEDAKKEESTKKKKKKKEQPPPEPEPSQKIEVSKEQFYKVSDSLKEAIAQPNSFSLRSLFGQEQVEDNAPESQDTGYTPLPAARKDKVRNPLDAGGKNPFKYDSSDSEPDAEETEDGKTTEAISAETVDGQTKAVWREKLFFGKFDNRFKEGLAFFNTQASGNKERRELKSLVKKRLYNRARKDQMFQKKIGGKRKSFAKKKQR